MGRATEARFTRRDYLQLPEGFPAELIEGQLVKEPAPTRWHQGVVTRLVKRLLAVVDPPERVLPGPVDVSIDRWSVLQPDVVVLAPEDAPSARTPDPPGVPVLVVEVLSPTTRSRDRDVKTRLYLLAGVSEVWLLDPATGEIEVHTAPDGVTRLGAEEEAVSTVVRGFSVSGGELVAPAA